MAKLRSFLKEKRGILEIFLLVLFVLGVVVGITFLYFGRREGLGVFTCLGMILLVGGATGLLGKIIKI
jgi:hypothetical protein